ncbi:MAG: ATPase [uncultured Sulfurovum sp.]|uniref:ATPase n=1 Tax=uncultured Sulfurovum sp. TaxID=269237 RepID=A0A6S6TV96_9BACT|nr:MAG: ATPase [uncultured Sulfurovum sp.]
MIKRSIAPILETALEISPIVLLSGARQVGKSTLSSKLFKNYAILDDVDLRLTAIENPKGFVHRLEKPVCIDEIQKAPNLVEAIKMDVDKDRLNGSYLLTGSANLLDMKKTKDTLAGRIIELSLYPLSAKERNNKASENVVDMLFNRDFSCSKIDASVIEETIISGGYPELLRLDTELKRRLWFSSYISTYIERDARELGEIREINNFFKFFNVIAPRTGTLLNKSKIAKASMLKDSMVDNFLTILAQLYQVELLRPYSENIGKQFVKSPKLHMIDTGIVCHLLRIKNSKALEESHYKGQIYETFIFAELKKHISFAVDNTDMFHYHTNDKKEVDFILSRGEQMLAIGVKASHSIGKGDFRHIFDFQKHSEKDILGIVFYMGDTVLEIDERNFAVPFGMFF